MEEIVIKATFGDEVKKVVISPVPPANSTYHVYMDNYYHGMIHQMLDGWRFSEQKAGTFCYEDIQYMIEVVRKHFESRK